MSCIPGMLSSSFFWGLKTEKISCTKSCGRPFLMALHEEQQHQIVNVVVRHEVAFLPQNFHGPNKELRRILCITHVKKAQGFRSFF